MAPALPLRSMTPVFRTIPQATLAVLVGVVSLTGCANSVPLRHTAPPPYDVVVARFLLDVDGLEADFADKGGGLVPLGTRVVQDTRDVAEAVETLLYSEGSAQKAAQDSVFAAVADGMAWQAGLRLLPLETLRGRVPYLVGAPMGRAQDIADARAVIELDLSVEVPDAASGWWSVLGTGRVRVSGHPELTLAVRMLSPDGDIVWRDQARVRSRERVVLDERWVLGVRTGRAASDASSLPALARRAVDVLLARRGQYSPIHLSVPPPHVP